MSETKAREEASEALRELEDAEPDCNGDFARQLETLRRFVEQETQR